MTYGWVTYAHPFMHNLPSFRTLLARWQEELCREKDASHFSMPMMRLLEGQNSLRPGCIGQACIPSSPAVLQPQNPRNLPLIRLRGVGLGPAGLSFSTSEYD